MMKQKKAGRARATGRMGMGQENKAIVRMGDATRVLHLQKLKLLHCFHGATWIPTS